MPAPTRPRYQAVTTVESTRPDESVLSAIRVGDVIEVRTVQATYTVAPSNSSEIRQVSTTPSWVAALDNLHRCLLSCQGPRPCGLDVPGDPPHPPGGASTEA